MTVVHSTQWPKIIVGATDAERLNALALAAEARLPDVSEALLDELERAEIRPDDAVPGDVVAMGSTVRFLDEAHGTDLTVRLVYPAEADISDGRISVLTPIGAGLLGLSPGQTILWPDRDGRERSLRVLEVLRETPVPAA